MIPVRLEQVVLAVVLALMMAMPARSRASDAGVDICHNDDEGNIILISVSENAVARHIANHGDVLLADSVFYGDADGDGAGDPDTSIHACTQPVGFVGNMNDQCPLDATKITKQTYYRDADQDGYGDPAVSVQACATPDGYVDNTGDCNDAEPLAWSGATEIPGDGVDNDCNPDTPDDLVACPCEALYQNAKNIWETQRGRGWNPALTNNSSICYETYFTNPSFQATDILLSAESYSAAGVGCYAIVREDQRESGGDVEFLLDTLIPYSTVQATQAAQKQACQNFLTTFCVP